MEYKWNRWDMLMLKAAACGADLLPLFQVCV